MQVDATVHFARDRAADDVDQAQRARAAALRFAQRRERIRGLTGLRDANNQRALVDNRIPIAELGGVFDLGGDTRELFHHVFTDEPRVP